MIFLFSPAFGAEKSSYEPVFLGVFKGSYNDYLPNLVPTYFYQTSATFTTGINDNMPNRLLSVESKFIKSAKKEAYSFCKSKNAGGYVIDSIDIKFNVFGDYSNILVYGSGNVVCLNSK
jgi:hypothetical protein